MFVETTDRDTHTYISNDILSLIKKKLGVQDKLSLNIALQLDCYEYDINELEHAVKNIQYNIKCLRLANKRKTHTYKFNGYQIFTSEFSSYVKHRYDLGDTGVSNKKLDDIIRRHDVQFPQDADDAQGTKTPYIWSYVLSDAEREHYMRKSQVEYQCFGTCSSLKRVIEKKVKKYACGWNIFVSEMKDVLPENLITQEKLWFISSMWKTMPLTIKRLYEKQGVINKLDYYIQIFDQYISAYEKIQNQ